jgi:hypothetical protein
VTRAFTLPSSLLVLATVLVAFPALGQGEGSRRIVIYIEGNPVGAVRAADLRDDIALLLPDDTVLEEDAKFRTALQQYGVRYELGHTITVPAMRSVLLRAVRGALKRVSGDGAVIGRLRRNRQLQPELYLLFVTPTRNEVLIDQAVPVPSGDSVGRLAALERVLKPVLDDVAPHAPLARPTPDAEPVEPDPQGRGAKPVPKPKPPPKGKSDDNFENRLALVAVEAAYRIGGRRFHYEDPGSPNLRPYGVFGAHMLALSLEAYPFAAFPVAEYFGLLASYSRAFGLETVSENLVIGTTYDNLRAGLGVRFRTGDAPAPVITLNGSFGWWRYRFSGLDNPYFDELPDVWYVFAAAGFELRVPANRVTLVAAADYLGPFTGGELAARFRDTQLNGLMTRVGIYVQTIEWLQARASVEYTAMFYRFESQPLDRYIAGSALDDSLGAQLGLAFTYY